MLKPWVSVSGKFSELMLNKIFRSDGFLWRGMNFLSDVLFLSVIWSFLCLTVAGIGPATTALYDAVVHGMRRKEEGIYTRFFRTLRTEFRVACFSGLLWGALCLICILTVRYLLALGETSRSAFAAGIAYYIVLIIPLGAVCWVFPLLSRFTFGFRSLNATALRFAVAYLPRTLILVLMTVEVLQFCLNAIYPFAFMPVLTMLLWSLFIEGAFSKYEPAAEDTSEEGVPDEKKDRGETK